MKAKLTDAAVAALPVPPTGYTITWDTEVTGLGARVTAGGARSWILNHRVGGKLRRETLGACGAMSAGAAREGAEARLAGARAPRKAVRKAPRASQSVAPAPAGPTFLAVAQDFLDHGKRKRGLPLKPRTKEEYRRVLLVHAAPLHARALTEIRRGAIASLIRSVARSRGETAAMRMRAALSRLWSWAIANDLVESNPVIGTEGYAAAPRDRVLKDAELRAIWAATAGSDDFDLIVRMAIWTGARRTEIGAMCWSELVGNSIWRVPGARTKNGRPLALPLPRQAVAALSLRWGRRRADRDLIFGRGKGGFSGWSQSLARLQQTSGTSGWSLHDLRRSAQTRMAKLGVRPDVVNRVLNHAVDKITATYDLHDYEPEKREALQRWADALDEIVGTEVARAA